MTTTSGVHRGCRGKRIEQVGAAADGILKAVYVKEGQLAKGGTLLGEIALWCTDYKGEFMPGNKKYCYPLTVSDHASRYLLLCEAMESVKEQGAFTAFARLFKERGLPQSIRSDNGVPFASPNGSFAPLPATFLAI
jgi:hypothetical protein